MSSVINFVSTICSFLLRDLYYHISFEPAWLDLGCHKCGKKIERNDSFASYSLYFDIWHKRKIRTFWLFHYKCHREFHEKKIIEAGLTFLGIAIVLVLLFFLAVLLIS